MNNQKIYKNITMKLLENKLLLHGILYEINFDIEIVKEYDIFTGEELKVLQNYDLENPELINIYLNQFPVNHIYVEIPEKVKKALEFLLEQDYSKEGLCYDIECENCFDWEEDIIINEWLNEDNIKIIYDIESTTNFDAYKYTKINNFLKNKHTEKSFKITKLYEYLIKKDIK